MVGTLRNETGAGQRVTLVVDGFNASGFVIATARATVDFVAAGRRANFEGRFRVGDRFVDCDRIQRVELVEVALG